jgi:hypothetical protein
MVFCFVQKIFFGQHKFFFFSEFNIRLGESVVISTIREIRPVDCLSLININWLLSFLPK